MPATDQPSRVLVVVAHPDDVDFGAAGTVSTWTDNGVHVAYCLVTDGDAGGFDPDVPRSEIGGIRQAEQTAAAKEVGVTDLHFLGYPDGYLEVSIPLRRDISRVIRIEQPDLVVTQSPQRNWERIYGSHPDHLATGEATMCAVYPDARNPFAHPELAAEGHEAHTVPAVWIMGTDQANHAIDITDSFDRKVAALQHHASQVSNRDPKEFADMLREWAARNAESRGLEAGRLAETFLAVETN